MAPAIWAAGFEWEVQRVGTILTELVNLAARFESQRRQFLSLNLEVLVASRPPALKSTEERSGPNWSN